MKRCRTRVGLLRLYYEGRDFQLDAEGTELPDELAESIRPHVNVIVEDAPQVDPEEPKRSSRKPKDVESEG